MEIGIKLNICTCVLLGIVTGLGYKLYTQNKKLKEMKGETGM